jgi:hypothetical protein
LDDEHYHMLLKDFFADITNPILDNRGQIYQYVGDEVVIAWNYSDTTNFKAFATFPKGSRETYPPVFPIHR